MSVIAISMVRDEADIIAETVGHMITQVDRVIVADNGSTDGTREILDGLGVWVLNDRDPAYFQSAKMSYLAQVARREGADWVVSFDADEWWMAKNGRIADTLNAMPDEALIVEAVLFDHVATGLDDMTQPPVRRMEWRRSEPAPLRKVACRAREGLTIHQGNHSASYDGVRHPLTVTGQLELRHFPLRDVRQMIRKARNGAEAYAATNLPESVGAHWRGWGTLTDEQIADVFGKWYFREDPTVPASIEGERQPPLVHDPVLCPTVAQ